LKGLDVKKTVSFFEKKCKVFEQLPLTLDHEVIQNRKLKDKKN
jgi:hypothetical protein